MKHWNPYLFFYVHLLRTVPTQLACRTWSQSKNNISPRSTSPTKSFSCSEGLDYSIITLEWLFFVFKWCIFLCQGHLHLHCYPSLWWAYGKNSTLYVEKDNKHRQKLLLQLLQQVVIFTLCGFMHIPKWWFVVANNFFHFVRFCWWTAYSLSKAEESIIVSLRADLSMDTPVSLCPHPLPSPHSTQLKSNNHSLSSRPSSSPHFPLYDVLIKKWNKNLNPNYFFGKIC